ncbi:hypothetical protein ETD86_37435 [Nonomuraea turkmeniaca]|uniref:Uncharacterized protein n=1 Tax=Nonomuraea turkmeniaca TaxID=103838 RepID=A0A5S4F4U3_9ACTN|nr:hypothetical protein [Nonomuraea turkmeniaca]TMR11001.1 hypothetical protein ETD86_37435 [Nonomuraea turkmeniaca]
MTPRTGRPATIDVTFTADDPMHPGKGGAFVWRVPNDYSAILDDRLPVWTIIWPADGRNLYVNLDDYSRPPVGLHARQKARTLADAWQIVEAFVAADSWDAVFPTRTGLWIEPDADPVWSVNRVIGTAAEPARPGNVIDVTCVLDDDAGNAGNGAVFRWSSPAELTDRRPDWSILWHPARRLEVFFTSGPHSSPVTLHTGDQPRTFDAAWKIVKEFIASDAWDSHFDDEHHPHGYTVIEGSPRRWDVRRTGTAAGTDAPAPVVDVTFTPGENGGSFTWLTPEGFGYPAREWEIIWRPAGLALMWFWPGFAGYEVAGLYEPEWQPETLEQAWGSVEAFVASDAWTWGDPDGWAGKRVPIDRHAEPVWTVRRISAVTWENATEDRHPDTITLPYVHVDHDTNWPAVGPGKPEFPFVSQEPGRVYVGEWAWSPDQAEQFAAVVALKAQQARVPDLDAYKELALFLARQMQPDDDGDVCHSPQSLAEAVIRRYSLHPRNG